MQILDFITGQTVAKSVLLHFLFGQILVQHAISVRQRVSKVHFFLSFIEFVGKFYLEQPIGALSVCVVVLSV